MIPANAIFIWGGTNATIPSGWERVTTLDDKYTKGTADVTDPNDTGGSHTHTHTSPEHTHTQTAHTHTGQTKSSDTSGGWTKDNSNASENGQVNDHYHVFTSDGPTDGSLVDAITYASVNQEPPYRKIIFIKPTANVGGFPSSIIALFGSATLPTSWEFCDGTGDIPDLRNRYLKGAGTGADADVTTDNGALTHIHALDHTHSASSHTHAGTTDGGGGDQRGSSDGSTINARGHTHSLSLSAVSLTGAAYDGDVTSGTVEPAYKKLLAIQNTSGGTIALKKGFIGMWLGTLATIPKGWQVCDGTNDTPDMRGKHLKIANTTGEIGDTGGANTHTHGASNSHTHTGESHSHTHTIGQTAGTRNTNGSGFGAIQGNHIHTQGSATNNAGTTGYSSVTVSGDESNNEPAYRTAAYIQCISVSSGFVMFL